MQTDYKNWVPKGMVKALALATCICAVFLFVLTAAVTVAPSTARWVGFGVFLTGFLVCGIALLWAVTAYRAFSFTGKRQLSRHIIDGISGYVNLSDNAKGLDVGCGSGILSVAALLLGAERAVGVDIDELAVKTAVQNAELNHVEDRFTALCGNLTDRVEGTYDIVVANIVADIVITLTKDVQQFLAPSAVYLMSGIIDTREQDVLQALEGRFEVIARREEKGWVALAAKTLA